MRASRTCARADRHEQRVFGSRSTAGPRLDLLHRALLVLPEALREQLPRWRSIVAGLGRNVNPGGVGQAGVGHLRQARAPCRRAGLHLQWPSAVHPPRLDVALGGSEGDRCLGRALGHRGWLLGWTAGGHGDAARDHLVGNDGIVRRHPAGPGLHTGCDAGPTRPTNRADRPATMGRRCLGRGGVPPSGRAGLHSVAAAGPAGAARRAPARSHPRDRTPRRLARHRGGRRGLHRDTRPARGLTSDLGLHLVKFDGEATRSSRAVHDRGVVTDGNMSSGPTRCLRPADANRMATKMLSATCR